MTNIHSYNPQKRLDSILEFDKISEQNKKDAQEFHRDLDIKESHVDKRVGHVQGSRVTRVYTRLDDSDSNNAYGQAYGEKIQKIKRVTTYCR